MTEPLKFPWATDATYGAGADAWSGQPNKVEPLAGRIEEGYVPDEAPPASEHNYIFNLLSKWIDRLATMSLGFIPANWAIVTGGNWGVPMSMGYCDADQAFWAIDEDGLTIFSIDRGDGTAVVGGEGTTWNDENTIGTGSPGNGGGGAAWAAGGTLVDIDGSPFYAAPWTKWLACSNSGVQHICGSLTRGTWAQETPATGGKNWGACVCDRTGEWIIGSHDGIIENAPGLAVPGALAFVARFASPSATAILRLGAARSASNPSNVDVMSIQAAAGPDPLLGYSSDNGDNWATWVSGWGTTPFDVAVNEDTGRWLIIDDAGVIHYSDSPQTDVWTTVATPLDNFVAIGATHARLACFRNMWICIADDAAGAASTQCGQWFSIDDGETWAPFYNGYFLYYAQGCLAAGAHGFAVTGDIGSMFSPPIIVP